MLGNTFVLLHSFVSFVNKAVANNMDKAAMLVLRDRFMAKYKKVTGPTKKKRFQSSS